MLKRSLVFTNPYHLKVRNSQLLIQEKGGTEEYQAPIEDVGFVLFEHPAITFTQGVIQSLIENNAAVVFCDNKHMPSAITLPLAGHFKQNENHYHQIQASKPLLKQLWQQTMKAKIKNQAAVLAAIGQDSSPLRLMARKVKSGDSENQEARAAKFYWGSLFGPDFRRDPEGSPPNPSLNYIYAILRAAVARSLISAGLSLTFGIHHHNKYNPFCLVDDIMEPFRPFGDLVVWQLKKHDPQYHVMTNGVKQQLLEVLNHDALVNNNSSPLMVAMQTTAQNLAQCYAGLRQHIRFPKFPEHESHGF